MNQSALLERFLSPDTRPAAIEELVALGDDALPVLEALFSGKAKNPRGIEYRKIGGLDGGYIAVAILGKKAQNFEPYLRLGIEYGNAYAIEAVSAFQSIDRHTAIALAMALVDKSVYSAAYSLVVCDVHENREVLQIVKRSRIAARCLDRAVTYLHGATV